jgi:PST family polysaccharide transporter
MWTLLQTVSSKGFALVSQLLLAGLLKDTEYASVALTILAVSIASLGQQLGLGEILVRNHNRFGRIAPAAMGLAVSAGALSLAGLNVAAPLVSFLFKAPELPGLLLVASLSLPFDAMALVPQSGLRIDMRFRTLALLGTLNVLMTSALSVIFAFMHMGAYSLILPRPIVSVSIFVATLVQARMGMRLQFRWRVWWYFLRHSGFFVTTNALNTFLSQGDYMLTGLFFPKETLGAYYFAFNLSTQSLQLISVNLTSVLLPSFAKIDSDRPRQMAAYERVGTSIMLVGMPGCLLQAVLAEPFLRIAFGHKWDAAIPLFQILSIGMIFVMPSAPSIVMLNAQGRYRALMIWTAVTTFSFLLSVYCGTLTGEVIGVASAVACFYGVFGPLGVVLPVLENAQQAVRLAIRVFVKPLLAGAIALMIGGGCGVLAHRAGASLEISLIVAGALVGGVYLAVVPLMLRKESWELISRLLPIVGRYRPRMLKTGGV